MNIQVKHSDGSIEQVNDSISLVKGDILIIDGKISDAESISLDDNQLTIQINGETVIIENTNLLEQNINDYENRDELDADTTGEHTAIVFTDEDGTDSIIDELNALITLTDTAASEEESPQSPQSHYHNLEFAERNGDETNVEADLRESRQLDSDSKKAEKDLREIEIETQADLYNYNDGRKKDPLSDNGGIPEDFHNDVTITENKDTDGSIISSENEINGGTDVIIDNTEDELQNVGETQEEENSSEDETNNGEQSQEEENEQISENEEDQGINESEEGSEEGDTTPETDEEDEGLDDSNNTSSEEGAILPADHNHAPEIQEENILTIDEDNVISFTKEDLLNNVGDENTNDILEVGEVTSNVGTVQEEDGIYTIVDVPENFNGTIELGMVATDGSIETQGTALITVLPINDIPTVDFINPTVLEDTSVTVDISSADIDGDVTEVSIFTGPDNGTATINENGELVYTPIENYNGTQEIVIKTTDGTDGTDIVYKTMEITVSPVNDEPEINIAQELNINEDSEGIVTFDITDIDGDNTSFTVEEPTNGTIIIDGTQITYIPNENYSGNDAITINYTDGTVQKSSTLNIDVQEVNDEPWINITNEVHMIEDEVQEILMDAGDIEGTIDITVEADNGVVIVDEDGNIVYSPNANYNGTDTIVINVEDENGAITTKNVNVQIDNDNSDIAYEIRTETITETHTEVVIHTETRDIEVENTREVEVLDNEANTAAGITYNSEDGKYYTTKTQTEVYNEVVTEEKTREVQEEFTNTRVEQETFTNTRPIEYQEGNQLTNAISNVTYHGYKNGESFEIKIDNWDAGDEIKDDNYPSQFQSILEQEQGINIVGYTIKSGKELTTVGENDAGHDLDQSTNDIVLEYSDYMNKDLSLTEEFQDTRDITVEFQDTRTVQENYTEDVTYERERDIEVQVEVESNMKIEDEYYTTTEQEEYQVQEEVEVTTSHEESIMDLTDSEYDIDFGILVDGSNEHNIDVVNIDDNTLSGVNFEDILTLSDSESIIFEGEDGSEINFSELPDTGEITSTGSVEKDGETYDTFTYIDNSLGQELDMMINNNIVIDL